MSEICGSCEGKASAKPSIGPLPVNISLKDQIKDFWPTRWRDSLIVCIGELSGLKRRAFRFAGEIDGASLKTSSGGPLSSGQGGDSSLVKYGTLGKEITTVKEVSVVFQNESLQTAVVAVSVSYVWLFLITLQFWRGMASSLSPLFVSKGEGG